MERRLYPVLGVKLPWPVCPVFWYSLPSPPHRNTFPHQKVFFVGCTNKFALCDAS